MLQHQEDHIKTVLAPIEILCWHIIKTTLNQYENLIERLLTHHLNRVKTVVKSY